MANRFAEDSVIGSILIDPTCFASIRDSILPSDFSSDLNRAVWETVCEMSVRGDTIDPVTIHGEMVRTGRDVPELVRYFAELMDRTPTAANVAEYVRIVKDAAVRDRIAELADRASDEARLTGDLAAVEQSVSEVLETIRSSAKSQTVDSAAAVESFRAWLDAVQKDPECAVVRSGFASLDRQLGGGFFKSGLYVVGARPGMGKTSVAVNLAEYIGASRRVLFISLEMERNQVTAKRIALQSGIGYNALMTGRLTDEDKKVLPIALHKVESRAVDVVDEDVGTVADLAALVTARADYDIVFVDYLGILTPSQEDAQKPRYEQITNISRDLKALAKRSHIPVVVLAQLNRENTKTANKRPTLTDLRDSGAIEQDADCVIMLHRKSYYEDEKPDQEDIELIVAKNRHGSCGTVTFRWDAPTGRIFEIDRREMD